MPVNSLKLGSSITSVEALKIAKSLHMCAILTITMERFSKHDARVKEDVKVAWMWCHISMYGCCHAIFKLSLTSRRVC